MRKTVLAAVAALLVLGLLTIPNIIGATDDPGGATQARQYDVRILRDTWGVPHIFGKTDADTAYGLAYAHAEDDFETIQSVILAARGKLASVYGRNSAPVDFMVHLLRVWDTVNERYETDLSPETRAICEATGDAVNRYIELHPRKARRGVYPVTGKDVVAGFVQKVPLFFGLDYTLKDLMAPERKHEVSKKQTAQAFLPGAVPGLPTGSNTFAVAPSRAADGKTHIAVNSHQPWDGPVAWYEAHLHSEEGWDMVGGVFPGTPVILHGHNRNLGWAHTVNSPDLVDIYELEINPDNPDQYRYDGEWRELEKRQVPITVKLWGKIRWTVKQEAFYSVHGPAVRRPHGTYAIRYAGYGDINQVEQWYRMNKARNIGEFEAAIALLNSGSIDVDSLVSHIIRLDDIVEEGFKKLLTPDDAAKVLVKP